MAAITLADGPANTIGNRHPPESVVIRFRPGYAICVGLCPYFETKVTSDGLVISRHHGSKRTSRFRVPPDVLNKFMARLNLLRPTRDLRADRECKQVTREDGSQDPLSMAKPDDIDVRWTDGRGQARLTACIANEAIRKPLQQALRDVGINPGTGNHINANGEWIP